MKWPFSRARNIEKAEVDLGTGTYADQMSLFVVVSVGARSRWRTRPLLDWPMLQTVGFASRWSAALEGRPRRFAKIDAQTIDKFVAFKTSPSDRFLATVRIREVLAYDLSYRSDISATGISIGVELHPQAMDPIVELLERHPGFDDEAGFTSGCVFRFPVRRALEFPEPRGADNPYASSSPDPWKLKDIGTIHCDWLEVAVMVHPSSPAVAWDTQPLETMISSSRGFRFSMHR